jgi:hypothetical protein
VIIKAMPIFRKGEPDENGKDQTRAVCLTGRLIKDATIAQRTSTKTGNEFETFNAYMQMEQMPYGEKSPFGNAIVVEAMGYMVKNLIAWPKGTILTVFGLLEKDEYKSKGKPNPVYHIEAHMIIAQENYRAKRVEDAIQTESQKYEKTTVKESREEDSSGDDELPF